MNWAEELYALWEGGKPHKMDPKSLRTEGEADVVLGQPLEVPQMAAHYRVIDSEDPTEKRLVAFSIESQAGVLQPNKCCFYEWDVHGKQAARNAFGVPTQPSACSTTASATENERLSSRTRTSSTRRSLSASTCSRSARWRRSSRSRRASPLSCTCSRGRTRRGRLARRPSTSITSSSFTVENAFEPEECDDASRVVIDSAPWRYMRTSR